MESEIQKPERHNRATFECCKWQRSVLKTKLMYRALISFNQSREYLSLLVENGLIEYEEGNHTYRTTEKGIRLLQLQNKTDEALHQLNLLWQRDIVLL